MLPPSLVEPLRRQLERAKALHDADIHGGFGDVYLERGCEALRAWWLPNDGAILFGELWLPQSTVERSA
jgi:hypothetical protein